MKILKVCQVPLERIKDYLAESYIENLIILYLILRGKKFFVFFLTEVLLFLVFITHLSISRLNMFTCDP